MFRSILVPLDGSPFGEQVLPLAEVLGRGAGTTLHLGHVPGTHGEGSHTAGGGDGGADRQKGEGYLNGLAERLSKEGVEADCRILEGQVVQAIENWARELEADLIVMATHGRVGLKRLRLGSVAESIVSHGLAPMLLLHPGAQGALARSMKNIVVAMDHSPFAQAIMDPLESFGAAVGATNYTLLHVADEHGVGKAGWAPLTALQSRASEHLEGFRHRLEGENAHVDVKVVHAPDPPRGILGVAESVDADVIAMTTHGMTGVRPNLLGSVAAKVLHSWEGPLLLVRPEEEA